MSDSDSKAKIPSTEQLGQTEQIGQINPLEEEHQNENEGNEHEQIESNLQQSGEGTEQQVQGQNTHSEYNMEELGLDDEALKFEIMKEFRRTYGDKLDKLFVRYNMETSNDVLEMVLRNIKLARQRMKKIEMRIPENDDLKTKALLIKYNKEFTHMLNNFNAEKQKTDYFHQRTLKVINDNLKVAQKIQEIQAQRMEEEIERRRKAREVKNHHNKLKYCNEVYQQALVNERQKFLEEVSYQKEIQKMENEEKRKKFEQYEKYYMDQIEILKEELREQKRQKELEYKANLVLLNKLQRERKELFKKQLNDIYNRFDEEDEKAEYQFNQIYENFL